MPKGRSYREVIEQGLKQLQVDFVQQQEAKAPKRLARRVGLKPKTGTLFAIRNKRLAIREAALRLSQIIITYKKTTTGETKKYVVAPYSYRYRRLKAGIRKMLFAYDMKDRHIKGFAIRNIRNVAITDRKFRPKWEVEIG
jgi:predicted DNA-binding transcriptional regulator YafY